MGVNFKNSWLISYLSQSSPTSFNKLTSTSNNFEYNSKYSEGYKNVFIYLGI